MHRSRRPAREHSEADWYARHAHRYRHLDPGPQGETEYYVALARAARPPALELFCGTGRVAQAIALAGIPATGIDRSSAMVAEARRHAAGLEICQFREADVRRFNTGDAYGLICIPHRSFGHMLTVEDQRAVLACAFSHLRPCGQLALNIAHPVPLTRLLGSSAPAGQPLFSEPFPGLRIRHVFPEEMQALLAGAGFVALSISGGFDGRALDSFSSEQVWTARRPGGSVHL